MAEFVRVAAALEIAPGTGKEVVVAGKTLAVFNVGGTFHCIDGLCQHRGGPLAEGDLNGAIVTCPLHAWRYDVTTGEQIHEPTFKLDCHSVRVRGDEIEIEASWLGRA